MDIGQPIPPAERAKRTNTQLIQNVNRSIRSDFGGRFPSGAIAEWLDDEIGLCAIENGGILSNDQFYKLVEGIVGLIKDQVEAIRSRTSHDRDELLRRFMKFQGDDPIQELERRVTILENAFAEKVEQ